MPAAAAVDRGAPALFSLLRSVLRLHRERLPPPMRTMGDTYVLSEFRRHLKNAGTTPAQWETFAVEWQRYAAMLRGTADQQAGLAAAPSPAAAGSGGSVTAAIAAGSMEEALFEQLNPEQRQRLIKLQQEALALGAEMLGKDASALLQGGGAQGEQQAGSQPSPPAPK